MKNLEKFNAETTPAGTPLITRDGREVTEWYYFKTYKQEKFPIVAVVDGYRETFTIEGRYSCFVRDCPEDLFIKPKVNECWVNIYQSSDGTIRTGADFYSREEALDHKKYVGGYIKTIRITDEPE